MSIGSSFLFSVNAVLPVFLLVIFGYLMKRIGILTDRFIREANRFVFRVTLPVSLYMDIVSCGSFSDLHFGSVFFIIGGILVLFLLLMLLVPLAVKQNDKRGALIQGIYRSNIAILGLPLIVNLFGDSGAAAMAVVMPFSIILYNALAVIVLSIFAPADKKKSAKDVFLSILKNIATNPLIIGIVLALITVLSSVSLPVFMSKSLGYLSDLTMPLALISLGADFAFEKSRGRLHLALIASLIRTVVVPVLFVSAAVLLGYRNEILGTVFIVFASPTAVSSYVMAENMGSDYELAGQIVLLTTLLSIFTIFAGVFLLKQFQLI